MTDKIKTAHILFVVENNSVPFDTRVWNEATSIRKICNNVSVICPQPKNENRFFKVIDNIKVYMYPNWIQGSGATGLISEYILSFFFISIYSLFVFLKSPFQIVHLANPPDFLSIIFYPFKLLGLKIVYDIHDLSPDVYIGKFGSKDIIYKILMLLEKISCILSDYIITVNESFKSIIIDRQNINKNKITVIRNGPRLEIVDKALKKKKSKVSNHLIGYVGIIDKQDNLEQLVTSIEYIVKKRKYYDFKMLIIGDGTDRENIEYLVRNKGLKDYFIFHGAEYNRDKLYLLLSDTEVCVDSRLCTRETKVTTAIKIMEYMAVGKPIVQYNTGEGRYSAGDASLYVENNDACAFGDAIITLLKDKKKRESMGKIGRIRIEKELQWSAQEEKLIRLYRNIFNS